MTYTYVVLHERSKGRKKYEAWPPRVKTQTKNRFAYVLNFSLSIYSLISLRLVVKIINVIDSAVYNINDLF